MGVLGFLTIAVSAVWIISEVRTNILKRPGASATVRDRSSHLVLMVSTVVSVAVGIMLKVLSAYLGGIGQITALSPYLGYFGCMLMVFGMIIRWTAIATLKSQFTVDVAIVKDHQIVKRGLYRLIRHPAYLGTLLTFMGLGLAWENWMCLGIMIVLRATATFYRISVEEQLLVEHFGVAYTDYMSQTRKLIPGIL